ncbi:MAG: iron-containing alcohol dehydrogenase [Clostridiales bacterium]|nr:iron-containing alcohol dehydrogenase [Clostridiales bacterium]
MEERGNMMEYGNFSFHFDSEIVFGRGTEAEAGRLVKKYGGTKAMIVYGSGSIKRSGLYSRLADSLKDAGIPFVEFGGVQPNPRRSLAEEGVRAAMAEGVDFLLGAGGGSAIDTAKAIAYGAANGGDFWQFFKGKAPEKMLPVGTVITIAATGSETSRSSVLIDDVDTNQKKGLWSSFRPRFAIMNPELTYSLPPYQTASGCVDILSHTFMRYFSNYPSRLGDRFGEAAMRTVVEYAPICLSEPENYGARAEVLLAGSLSHSDLMIVGRPASKAGGEHALESQLSGHYDTAHGAGLGVIMPALLKYFTIHGTEEQVSRVARFAEGVFCVSPDAGDTSERALLGIERFYEWLRGLGMPTTLTGLGIPAEEIPDAVSRCMKARGATIEGFMTLDEAAVTEIYEMAK